MRLRTWDTLPMPNFVRIAQKIAQGACRYCIARGGDAYWFLVWKYGRPCPQKLRVWLCVGWLRAVCGLLVIAMYSPAGSGYGYSPAPRAPVVAMDRLNISPTDPHSRSPGLTADYGRTDNGYVPGSHGSCCYFVTRLLIIITVDWSYCSLAVYRITHRCR